MIEIKNLNVSYSSKRVLTDLNATFASGQVHGILGINGAGKSTFFNTIYGTKKLVSGSLTLDGELLHKDNIAYLMTDNFFYPYMKGKEYLQLVAPNASYVEWNAIFELPLDEFAVDYSTGMKKKLAFMGLILRDRKLYILDEPFNGVDIQSNEILLRIIDALKSKGKYILVSSHILVSLLHMSDQIHHLQNGQFGTPILKQDFQAFEASFKQEIDDQLSVKLKSLNL